MLAKAFYVNLHELYGYFSVFSYAVKMSWKNRQRVRRMKNGRKLKEERKKTAPPKLKIHFLSEFELFITRLIPLESQKQPKTESKNIPNKFKELKQFLVCVFSFVFFSSGEAVYFSYFVSNTKRQGKQACARPLTGRAYNIDEK